MFMKFRPLIRTLSDRQLICLFTLFSFLFAGWIMLQRHDRINTDAVLYLEMAKRFAAADYHGALDLYNWPLFPWLMAITHTITGLSVQHAAYLLQTIFFSITTWGFLTLIREGGGNRRTIITAAVLLFSAPYIVGYVLSMIMRDQGFWAFHVLSLLFFFRFWQRQKFTDALLWQIAAILAILFRVEAVSFIVLLPLCLMMRKDLPIKQRFALLASSYALLLFGSICAIILMLSAPASLAHSLGRLPEIHTSLLASYHQLSIGLAAKAKIYGELVLGNYLAEYAISGLIATFLIVIVGKVAGATSWLATGLACLPYTGEHKPGPDIRTVLFWAAGINILNLAVILLTVFTISGRYAISLSFIILFFAAFKLAGMTEEWTLSSVKKLSVRDKFIGIVVAVFTTYWLIANVIQHDRSNSYEQRAVSWVKKHAPADAAIFYDEARLRYYADAPWDGRGTDWAQISGPTSKPYDYLVLHISHKDAKLKLAQVAQMKQYRQVQEFKAKNGDRIWILTTANRHP